MNKLAEITFTPMEENEVTDTVQQMTGINRSDECKKAKVASMSTRAGMTVNRILKPVKAEEAKNGRP